MGTKYPNIDRTLFLRGEITEENTGEIIEKIIKINDFDDISCRGILIKPKRPPIMLHIQSAGGSVLDGLSLINVINSSKSPVYTYCDGYVESTAFDIFMSGERRFGHIHSYFMIHPMKISCEDMLLKDVKNYLNYMQKLENRDINFLQSFTNIPQKIISEIFEKGSEYRFGINEAVEYGVVTDLISKDRFTT